MCARLGDVIASGPIRPVHTQVGVDSVARLPQREVRFVLTLKESFRQFLEDITHMHIYVYTHSVFLSRGALLCVDVYVRPLALFLVLCVCL